MDKMYCRRKDSLRISHVKIVRINKHSKKFLQINLLREYSQKGVDGYYAKEAAC